MEKLHIEQEVRIEAEPTRVFDALTTEIGAWWNHRFSEAPKGIYLEPKVGGRFYEEFNEKEEGALYATVTYLERGKKLRMAGPMGMSGAVTGVVDFELEPKGKATLLKLSHRVIGEVSDETKKGYTAGWQELLNKRLKDFIERGIRSGVAR